jgi:hypothetical protein
LHLPGERFTQRLVKAPGAINVPFIAGHEKRREKRDALDMIPMRVADEDMTAQAFCACGNQLLTKRMCSGSAIEDNKCSSRRAHLDARRVSAVTSGPRSRLGDRTSSTPELNAHFSRLLRLPATV